jgi:hypothetical protein
MKFRAEIEFDIEDGKAFVGQPARSQAHLNELVKVQINDDLLQALHQYGMVGEVVGVRKLAQK